MFTQLLRLTYKQPTTGTKIDFLPSGTSSSSASRPQSSQLYVLPFSTQQSIATSDES